jgi:mRNA-degrading endonuclease RelE of RelBE toxin-antitoxin system
MSFNVSIIPDAKRDVKQLVKKYPSFKLDLETLISSLEENPQQGEPLGKDCFKVRIAIRAKKKGKSGGARVITCVKIIDEEVFLVAVYDKREFDTLTDKTIEQRLRNAGL